MDWLRQIPIGQYVDGSQGWLRRMDPRLKLAWSLVFLVTPVLAGPLWRVGLLTGLLIVTVLSGLPRSQWWRSLLILILLGIFVGLLSMLLPPLLASSLARVFARALASSSTLYSKGQATIGGSGASPLGSLIQICQYYFATISKFTWGAFCL